MKVLVALALVGVSSVIVKCKTSWRFVSSSTLLCNVYPDLYFYPWLNFSILLIEFQIEFQSRGPVAASQSWKCNWNNTRDSWQEQCDILKLIKKLCAVSVWTWHGVLLMSDSSVNRLMVLRSNFRYSDIPRDGRGCRQFLHLPPASFSVLVIIH